MVAVARVKTMLTPNDAIETKKWLLQTPLQKLGGVLSNPEYSSKNQGGELT